jgi:tetratricopeptide (TPR) repeat protein
MRLTISIGEYSTTPYTIPGLEIPVYCLEELCCQLRESAVLVDRNVMTRNLVDWIRVSLGLSELAEMLYPLVQRQGSLSSFVGMILEYAGLYDYSVVQEVCSVLKKGAGLSTVERHKQQIDYLTEKHQYQAAIRGYSSLLEKWKKIEERDQSILPGKEVLAAIYHNMGVARAGLMEYAAAEESFRKAWEISEDPQEYETWLVCRRMGLSEEDYIVFCADHPKDHEKFLKIEKKMKALTKSWEESPEAKALVARKELRESHQASDYYEDNLRVAGALKESYRDQALTT